MSQDIIQSEFEKAFEQLNEKQREAVVNFEGPMLVVAGPGTGKTQLLAIRIGYILQNSDTQAENILALTYTDAGAIAMRQRLLKFIGPAAYRVNIFTFHAFCNKVINENNQYFGGYRNLQPISDVEQIQLLNEMIDEFDVDHPLKRLSGNIYFENWRLKNLFSTMKQESWTSDDFERAIEQYTENFKNDDKNYYGRKYKEFNKGDLKINNLNKELDKFGPGLAASKELEKYDKKLLANERYDYQDMILWVIDAFKNNEELLLDYQERYHYFLIDEYQDTNGSQNELVFLLTDFWDHPNVFAVGDDDQSIYRFQGASMKNLLDFQAKFNPKVVVLDQNYRSTQVILDESRKLIENNNERLIKSLQLNKILEAARLDIDDEHQTIIRKYANVQAEQVDVCMQIERMHKEGKDLSKVGVLYRKHKQVDEIVKYLSYQGVPIQLKKKINVLENSDIQRLLEIFRFIQVESESTHNAEDLLFRILHFKYFKLSPKDIGNLSLYANQYRRDDETPTHWRFMIGDKETLKVAGVENVDGFLAASMILESLISDVFQYTLQVFIEKVILKIGYIKDIMNDEESTWKIQILNSFFNFVKDESQKNPRITLNELLELVDIMIEQNIAIPLVKFISQEQGVQFTTIHSAKGLEYDTVFIIGCTSKSWKVRGRNGYKIPDEILENETGDFDPIEELRRLFYVAMTRAQNRLIMSYSQADENEKQTEPNEFLAELEPDTDKHESIEVTEKAMQQFYSVLWQFKSGEATLIDHDLINQKLEHFSLNATGLNKYLACPLTFYFENILRVPSSRNKYNGFGNAIHAALESYFIEIKNKPTKLPPLDNLLQYFTHWMRVFKAHFTQIEYDNYLVFGKECLSKYYEEYSGRWLGANDYELEYKIDNTEHNGVPINGTLDRVMVYPHGVQVIDYKTGSYKSEKFRVFDESKEELGGDYWRQIVFYAILVKEFQRKPWNFIDGSISYVQPNKKDTFDYKTLNVSDEEYTAVSNQITETYQGIQDHNFEGCGEDECRWCNFVQDNFTLENFVPESIDD